MLTVVFGASFVLGGLVVGWDLRRNGAPPAGLLGTGCVSMPGLGLGGGSCLLLIGLFR